MALLDSILPQHQRRPTRTGSKVITLTPLGKSKAERFDQPGVTFQVLNHLSDSGPSTLNEIANATSLSPMRVKAVVQQLQRQGIVRVASADDEG